MSGRIRGAAVTGGVKHDGDDKETSSKSFQMAFERADWRWFADI